MSKRITHYLNRHASDKAPPEKFHLLAVLEAGILTDMTEADAVHYFQYAGLTWTSFLDHWRHNQLIRLVKKGYIAKDVYVRLGYGNETGHHFFCKRHYGLTIANTSKAILDGKITPRRDPVAFDGEAWLMLKNRIFDFFDNCWAL